MVIVTPEVSSRRVLISGNPQTFSSWVPVGGQTAPTAMDGIKLRWKKDQKNAKNNITSEVMNSSTPRRRPF
jgi:hypothetical protein